MYVVLVNGHLFFGHRTEQLHQTGTSCSNLKKTFIVLQNPGHPHQKWEAGA